MGGHGVGRILILVGMGIFLPKSGVRKQGFRSDSASDLPFEMGFAKHFKQRRFRFFDEIAIGVSQEFIGKEILFIMFVKPALFRGDEFRDLVINPEQPLPQGFVVFPRETLNQGGHDLTFFRIVVTPFQDGIEDVVFLDGEDGFVRDHEGIRQAKAVGIGADEIPIEGIKRLNMSALHLRGQSFFFFPFRSEAGNDSRLHLVGGIVRERQNEEFAWL